MSQRNSLNECMLCRHSNNSSHFLCQHFILSSAYARMKPSLFHAALFLSHARFFLIKNILQTHKITKYNHYKRIIHLKLLDSFIDSLTQSNLPEKTKMKERIKLSTLLSCQSISIHQMGYFAYSFVHSFVHSFIVFWSPSHVRCHRLDGIIVVTL